MANRKAELLATVILDRDGQPRMYQPHADAEKRPLLVKDILAESIFMLDSRRLITNKEELETVLPAKVLENYRLWRTIIDDEETLNAVEIEQLIGYTYGNDGSDCVKQQVITTLKALLADE